MCVVMRVYIVLVCSQAPKVCLRCSTDPINGAKKSSFMAFLDSSTGRPGWGLWSLGQGSNLELPKFDPRPWHTRHLAIVLPQLSLFWGAAHRWWHGSCTSMRQWPTHAIVIGAWSPKVFDQARARGGMPGDNRSPCSAYVFLGARQCYVPLSKLFAWGAGCYRGFYMFLLLLWSHFYPSLDIPPFK